LTVLSGKGLITYVCSLKYMYQSHLFRRNAANQEGIDLGDPALLNYTTVLRYNTDQVAADLLDEDIFAAGHKKRPNPKQRRAAAARRLLEEGQGQSAQVHGRSQVQSQHEARVQEHVHRAQQSRGHFAQERQFFNAPNPPLPESPSEPPPICPHPMYQHQHVMLVLQWEGQDTTRASLMNEALWFSQARRGVPGPDQSDDNFVVILTEAQPFYFVNEMCLWLNVRVVGTKLSTWDVWEEGEHCIVTHDPYTGEHLGIYCFA
jgi:hypothetical protein